jgi:hypothetical protein
MMLGLWSANKGAGQQFHAPLKDFLLRQIAFEMHRRQATDLPVDEFREMVSTTLRARNLTGEIDILIEEMLIHSGLFRINDKKIEFRHLLLQEFFAGRGIPSVDQLETVISDDWWQRAIVFYFGEHPDDVKGLQSARDAVSPRTDGERYRAAITIGLALQACYLVEIKDKVDVFKWVVQIMARSKKGFLQASEESGAPPLMAFLWYYIFGRDAVACAIPVESRRELLTALCAEALDQDERDTCEFWSLITTIETEIDDLVEKDIKRFEPTDKRLLFGLYVAVNFIQHLRVASRDEKTIAQRLATRLSDRVAGIIQEFSKQFRSVLLEVRQGKLAALGDPGFIDAEAADRETTE